MYPPPSSVRRYRRARPLKNQRQLAQMAPDEPFPSPPHHYRGSIVLTTLAVSNSVTPNSATVYVIAGSDCFAAAAGCDST